MRTSQGCGGHGSEVHTNDQVQELGDLSLDLSLSDNLEEMEGGKRECVGEARPVYLSGGRTQRPVVVPSRTFGRGQTETRCIP